MAKMADGSDNTLLILLPPQTNDLSLAMTSSYSSMYLACAMIANIENIEEHKDQIEAVAAATAESLPKYNEAIKAMAERNFNRAVFLGSGELMGVAEESRLKLQELTDGTVMCAFDSFLGFRHGPKAVINKDTLLVYLLSEEPATQRYEYDLIRQIKANNDITGYVAVSQSEPTVGAEYFDLNVVIGVPAQVKRCYKSVSYIFVAQLLGFYKALDLKRSPDNPSVSGNISRVVEGVIIYE
jgi:tagatose-6-phosphate ketose/aldose isomerase